MFDRAPKFMSYAEYLAVEQSSSERHEWFDGEISAMAAGTPEHAYLMAAVTGELRNLLRGRPCIPFSSDLRLRSMATGLSTYSDAVVVCGPVVPHPGDADACTNPVVIVEVLSPSTEAYDRGKKFDHYQAFPTLRDYVLVATGRNHVDHYTLAPDGGWTMHPDRFFPTKRVCFSSTVRSCTHSTRRKPASPSSSGPGVPPPVVRGRSRASGAVRAFQARNLKAEPSNLVPCVRGSDRLVSEPGEIGRVGRPVGWGVGRCSSRPSSTGCGAAVARVVSGRCSNRNRRERSLFEPEY